MNPLIVVLPVAKPDFHLAVKWIKWVKELHCSGHLTEEENFTVMIYAAKSLDRTALDTLFALIDPAGHKHPGAVLKWLLEVQAVGYEHPELGYAAAANAMMLGALETMERLFPGHPMLCCEAYAIPVCARWHEYISKEYAACGKPFMGDFHAGGDIPHMTGVAVYPPDWRAVAPSLAKILTDRPEMGWDSKCSPETVPQSHRSFRIQQIWMPPRFSAETLNRLHPETALFHRCKDGTLIDTLAARLQLPAIKTDSPMVGLSPIHARTFGSNKGPDVEILLIAYWKDMDFLRYCIRSIALRQVGFAGVTLAVPNNERGNYNWIPSWMKIAYFTEIPGKGMLSHLIAKCRADEICPNADAILHVDADCIFWENFTPEDFMPFNKPVMVRERYDQIRNPHRQYWKETVNKATGLNPVWETMVRHPQIHLRGVYARTRELVAQHTGMPFDDYVLAGKNDFPQTFCEFNTLGAVAQHEFTELYTMIDYDRATDALECNQDCNASWQYIYRRGRDKLVEAWSHGGIASYQKLFDNIMNGKPPEIVVK